MTELLETKKTRILMFVLAYFFMAIGGILLSLGKERSFEIACFLGFGVATMLYGLLFLFCSLITFIEMAAKR